MTMIHQDFETQSLLDLPITGTMRYVLDTSTRCLLWSWALDEDPVKLWCPDMSAELAPEVWAYVNGRMAAVGACPAEVVEALKKPDTYIVGWNEAFDRHVWQQVATPENNFHEIRIEQTLDAMSQAQASNLPGSLEFAGRALGLGQKTIGGKAIMKRFADRALPLPGAAVTVDAAPDRARAIKDALEMWALYLDYSVQDTELMRSVWNVTRPLDLEEWQTYWASERINDRGLPVDIDVCAGAVQYREEEAVHTEAECARITKGAVTRLTLTKQINEWVFDRLPDDLAETMVKARDDDGYVTRLTGDKNIMTRLLEDIAVSDTPPADDVIELLELMQFGRSSSAIKFEKMLNQQVDGRVFGSYVFNGAGQTHRYSARGIQTHNFPRAYLENELDVLDMVAARVPIEQLREHGPVGALLAKLIRPTIVAPLGKVFVWADYSAIEARVTPWLAASRDADSTVLELFRRGDDLYTTTAGDIFNVNVAELEEKLAAKDPEAKGMRQASKVACLALGFLGGVGAYKAMARGYGMRVTDEEGKIIVDGWRERNRWAHRFGMQIEAAAFSALENPHRRYKAGRIEYEFLPNLMKGTLICWLPDGRPLVYPMVKVETQMKFDKPTKVITYMNGMSRNSTWRGKLLENAVQSVAAGLLRGAILRLDQEETQAGIVLHTHDEIGGEVDEAEAWPFADRLVETMVRGYDWSEGLPLAAEVEVSYYYTKDEKAAMKRPS